MIVGEEVLEQFGVDQEAFETLIKSQAENSLLKLLDMEYVEVTADRLVMKMPVGPKVHQPAGILHGGISVTLAETAASMATLVNIDMQTKAPVGMEINANHIRSKKEGELTAVATPFHKGRTSMIWNIEITDENNKLVCISRCTMAVIDQA